MTDDGSIFSRIDELVSEEHGLRAKLSAGEISNEDEHARLTQLETDLDRCWDLLRQRRAKREFGDDPADAQVRAADVRSKASSSITSSWNQTAFAPFATAWSAMSPASSDRTNTSTTSTSNGMSASVA